MKIFIGITALLLFFSTAALGANHGSINKGDMQNMMQAMQQMQQCMEQIDQARLEQLKSTSEGMTKEIDSLCSQGKRDEAMKVAMKFGKEIATDPTVQQMRTCGEIAQGAMPMPDMFPTYDEKDYASKHVCDNR